MPDEKLYYCSRCNRTLKGSNFYSSNNLVKYPDDGKMGQCKQCMTAHVDNWDPETFKWILEEVDVPYVPDEWNKLLAKYGQNPAKLTGATILGRYLSKMKLKQYRDYRWEHTEFLQQMADHKLEETMKRQGFDAAEIAEAVSKGGMIAPERPEMPQTAESAPQQFVPMENNDYEDPMVNDLTEEDKKYLSIKWGKIYKPEEWVRLEQLYEEMMGSYDIQTAGHIDNLKLLCKTSLKANQLLDIGDVDGAQKMLKMYDSLMKSGKFTAAQNKAESGEYVDSISEIVAICEKDGFIPRYYTDGPQDKVDRTLQDLQNYTKTLVTEEMNLGNLIENALKQIEEDKEREASGEAEAASDEELLEMELFAEDSTKVLTDEEFVEFTEFEEQQEKENEDIINKILNGEE